jgi:cullin-associated NEDD8-dissociated protein 1
VFPCIGSLQDKGSNSGLKIEALLFLKMAMLKSKPAVFQPHVTVLSKPVFAAVGDRYYKVTSEALRVCERMVHVICPDYQPVSGNLQVVSRFPCLEVL